jgi:hypothetical protein
MLNAMELARLLRPTAASIDVVCHSRGGLVARWWLEALDRGQAKSRRVVFIGSPLAGTGLASPANLKSSLSLLCNIAQGLGTAAAAIPFLTVVAGVFRVAVSVARLAAKTPAIDAAVALVPGLAAQSRVGNNQEILALRRGTPEVEDRYFAVTADFRSEQPGWKFWRYFQRVDLRAENALSDLVFEGRNDLVVDSNSMTQLSDNLVLPPSQVHDFGTTDRVHHTTYFDQPETFKFLRDRLGT